MNKRLSMGKLVIKIKMKGLMEIRRKLMIKNKEKLDD